MRTFLICLLAFVTLSGNTSAQGGPATNSAGELRVDSILAQLTLDEKIGLLGGVNIFDVPGLARLVEGKPFIQRPLTHQSYGDWEFEVRDPNGYVLVFGGAY